ncbi:oligopeptide/dipeptide ABC transporter ATP-binding protein [Roseibium sp. HPY-6]|uniref:ABC transporter ATP-binding protein n=1 Tax=Roseibium sp. HPY-6 TaxID=3229852 RepID=UPI00338DDAC2
MTMGDILDNPATNGVPRNRKDQILAAENLTCHFTRTKGPFYARKTETVKALQDVSFGLGRGQSLGIVGESGSGKSTLARCLMRLETPTSGKILFKQEDISQANSSALLPVRRDMQMVFQDPWASLNPRHTVAQIISEPWEIHPDVVPLADRAQRIAELLEMVGLDKNFAHRFPNQFSGGQRQRISIARALALQPDVLILDEAVSALDVSVQAQILNLLAGLREQLGMTYLFISHDLSVVRHICDRVAVMYLGRIVETGSTEDIFRNPRHPYTRALLSAMPDAPESERVVLEGEVPSPLNPPSGCGFRTRCWLTSRSCADQPPELLSSDVSDSSSSHKIACFHPLQSI